LLRPAASNINAATGSIEYTSGGLLQAIREQLRNYTCKVIPNMQVITSQE